MVNEKLIKRAEGGDVKAQFELATSYFESGEAFEGAKWLEKSAMGGYAVAQYFQGNMRKDVYGDVKGATEWYKKAASQNYAPAQGMMALTFVASNNFSQARNWAERAYKNGDRDNSPLVFAQLYLQGNGGYAQDVIKAYQYTKESAENGNETAAQLKAQMENAIPQLKWM